MLAASIFHARILLDNILSSPMATVTANLQKQKQICAAHNLPTTYLCYPCNIWQCHPALHSNSKHFFHGGCVAEMQFWWSRLEISRKALARAVKPILAGTAHTFHH